MALACDGQVDSAAIAVTGNCYGLQKMVDICSDYGNRFWIRFNSSKSQKTVFGGRSPPHFVVKLNEAPVPYMDTVKYLGVFINSRTNNVDPSAALRKFFGCFNNNYVSSWQRCNASCVFSENLLLTYFIIWL